MIDALNFFHRWLKSHRNFLQEPIPSLAFDEALSQTKIQLALSHSRSNRALFGEIEEEIAMNYAKLIDFQLRTLRQPFRTAHIKAAANYVPPVEKNEDLEASDLSSPENSVSETDDQIAARKKAAKIQGVVASYFRCYEVFVCFIKYDMSYHHLNRDAKVSAFRRWINVADKLVEKNNYDGACLVMAAISYMAKTSYLTSLPMHYQTRYAELDSLLTPYDNYQHLRTRMDSIKDGSLLSPLSVCTKDMESINGVLKGEMSRPARENSKLQLKRLAKGYRKSDTPIEPIPVYLLESYEAMCRLVPTIRPESSMADMFAATPIGEPGSSIYSHKLAPTFWHNRDSQTQAMWKRLLPLSNNVSYTG